MPLELKTYPYILPGPTEFTSEKLTSVETASEVEFAGRFPRGQRD